MKIKTKRFSIQDYFYIGYLYLIILGIVSDAIFYGLFEVSYLNYTTILDALISPISLLTNNWVLAVILALMMISIYLYTTKWLPKIHAKFRDKKWYRKINNIEKVDKNIEALKGTKNIVTGLLVLFFFFLFP